VHREEPGWAAELPSSFDSLMIPALPCLLHLPLCHPEKVAWCLQGSDCRSGGHPYSKKCCLFTVVQQSCSLLVTSVVYVVKLLIAAYSSGGTGLENFPVFFSQAPADFQPCGQGHELLTKGCYRCWNYPEYLLTQIMHVCNMC